jgi:hypothetical protein
MRHSSLRFLFLGLVLGFALLLSTGCAQFEFDVIREGSSEPIHVATSDDAHLANDPLQYRMRAADGHLVMWIDNPTSDSIQLLGSKSSVTDPDGADHPLHGQIIGPQSSIKEILPPVESQEEPATPTPPPPPINPYDRPGFIPVPGVGQTDSIAADSRESVYAWQWDDESEIRIHLVFVRDGRQFEQRFTIRRVKK